MTAIYILAICLSGTCYPNTEDMVAYCNTDVGEQDDICDDTDGVCEQGGACYVEPSICWQEYDNGSE